MEWFAIVASSPPNVEFRPTGCTVGLVPCLARCSAPHNADFSGPHLTHVIFIITDRLEYYNLKYLYDVACDMQIGRPKAGTYRMKNGWCKIDPREM